MLALYILFAGPVLVRLSVRLGADAYCAMPSHAERPTSRHGRSCGLLLQTCSSGVVGPSTQSIAADAQQLHGQSIHAACCYRGYVQTTCFSRLFFNDFCQLYYLNFHHTDFFTVFTTRCYASTVLAMGLCLSITSRCSTKTAKRRITQTTPHDSPETLVFLHQRSQRNSTGVTHYGGAKCRWGGSKLATFGK